MYILVHVMYIHVDLHMFGFIYITGEKIYQNVYTQTHSQVCMYIGLMCRLCFTKIHTTAAVKQCV